MMRLLLPVVLLLLGLGGGVGAGLMLGGDDPAPAEASATGEGDGPEGGDHAEVDADAEHGEGDDGHGEADAGHSEPPSVEQTGNGTEYVRLNNQFVIPIIRNGAVRSLVVMSLSVEVGTGQSGSVFDREPRLRDSFLRVMFAHANAGGFDGMFTEAAAIEPLREALREAAQGTVSGATVYDVLITDITRQDA